MTRPAPAAAVPLVLIPALGLSQGGFPPDRWVWAGALAAWAAALAAVLADDAGGLRAAWPWLAAAGALLAWTLASALWSVDADQSVLDARRTLAYTAVVLALLVLARPGAGGLVLATHAAITFLVVWALCRYLFGAHHTIIEANLLSEPLGYANAVGIVAVLGSLLGLGVAAGTRSPRVRAAGAATLPLLVTALELSGSSASWLALALGLGVMVVLEPARARVLRVLASVSIPCAATVVLARESGLSAPTPGAPRVDGWVVAVAGAACALAAAALAGRVADAPLSKRALPTWVPAAVALALLALAFAAVIGYGAARQPRSLYYRVAWHHEYLAHPLLGSGAGTFGSYWDRFGDVAQWGGALDTHSLYLETLAELGPLGLVLVLAFVAYPLRTAFVARGRPYVPAAAAAYVAFAFHAGLDWDWEMPVVVVAGLACGAAVVAGALTTSVRLATTARAAVVGASLVLGGIAIAGARSHAQPGSALKLREAPKGLSLNLRVRRGYDLP